MNLPPRYTIEAEDGIEIPLVISFGGKEVQMRTAATGVTDNCGIVAPKINVVGYSYINLKFIRSDSI
jgi:hypothetical protein